MIWNDLMNVMSETRNSRQFIQKKLSKIKEKNSGIAYIDGVINWPRFSI